MGDGGRPSRPTSARGVEEVAIPADLTDRRVEITGPTNAKMVINALNSGARGFMADFEDSNSPLWANMVGGQVNLADAARGSMEHEEKGKAYRLEEDHDVLYLTGRPERWISSRIAASLQRPGR